MDRDNYFGLPLAQTVLELMIRRNYVLCAPYTDSPTDLAVLILPHDRAEPEFAVDRKIYDLWKQFMEIGPDLLKQQPQEVQDFFGRSFHKTLHFVYLAHPNYLWGMYAVWNGNTEALKLEATPEQIAQNTIDSAKMDNSDEDDK